MPNLLALNGGPKVRRNPFSAWPVYDRAEEQALLDVLHSGSWGRIDGEQVARFEESFAGRAFGPFSSGGQAREDRGYDPAGFPVCERACSEACWLVQPTLLGTREDMDDIVRAVEKIYEGRNQLR